MASKKSMNQFSFTNLRLSKPRFRLSLRLVLAFLHFDSFGVSSEKTSVLKNVGCKYVEDSKNDMVM